MAPINVRFMDIHSESIHTRLLLLLLLSPAQRFSQRSVGPWVAAFPVSTGRTTTEWFFRMKINYKPYILGAEGRPCAFWRSVINARHGRRSWVEHFCILLRTRVGSITENLCAAHFESIQLPQTHSAAKLYG